MYSLQRFTVRRKSNRGCWEMFREIKTSLSSKHYPSHFRCLSASSKPLPVQNILLEEPDLLSSRMTIQIPIFVFRSFYNTICFFPFRNNNKRLCSTPNEQLALSYNLKKISLKISLRWLRYVPFSSRLTQTMAPHPTDEQITPQVGLNTRRSTVRLCWFSIQ